MKVTTPNPREIQVERIFDACSHRSDVARVSA